MPEWEVRDHLNWPTRVSAKIEHVLTHPEEAREMGRRARQRIIERYSWDVMDRILHDAIESVAARMKRRTTAADL